MRIELVEVVGSGGIFGCVEGICSTVMTGPGRYGIGSGIC